MVAHDDSFLSLFDAFMGAAGIFNSSVQHAGYVALGLMLVYLGIRRGFAPMFMVAAGSGMVMANLPTAGVAEPGSFFYYLYFFGVSSGALPLLLFFCLGAAMDFGPLLARPALLIVGAAAQVGFAATFMIVLLLRFIPSDAFVFDLRETASAAFAAGADGALAVFVSYRLAENFTELAGFSAFMVMASAHLIQPAVVSAFAPRKELMARTDAPAEVSKRMKLIFPAALAVLCAFFTPPVAAVAGMLALGNAMKETGGIGDGARSALLNCCLFMLGLALGSRIDSDYVFAPQMVAVTAAGFIGFALATAAGVVAARLFLKTNPAVGAAGVPSFGVAPIIADRLGLRESDAAHLHEMAMGANAAGMIGFIAAAGVFLTLL